MRRVFWVEFLIPEIIYTGMHMKSSGNCVKMTFSITRCFPLAWWAGRRPDGRHRSPRGRIRRHSSCAPWHISTKPFDGCPSTHHPAFYRRFSPYPIRAAACRDRLKQASYCLKVTVKSWREGNFAHEKQVSKSLVFEADFSTPLTGFLLVSSDNYVIILPCRR